MVLTNTSATPSFARTNDRLAYPLLPPTPTDARARMLFTGLQHGTPERAALTPEFSAFLNARRLESYAASLGPLGRLNSLVLRSEEEADGVTERRYAATAGGQLLSLIWEETADGRTDDFPSSGWSSEEDPHAATYSTLGQS